jgi:hypothetical protein
MIYETLNFLSVEVNKYLNQKLTPLTDSRLKLGNVSQAFDESGSGNNSLKEKAILSLVNIEEDRVSKQHENFTKDDLKTYYKNPPLFVNLYVLFSIYKDKYDDSLIWLGHIIQFFQHQNSFTSLSHPNLDPRIKKLMVDMYTMNFEQVNHLWSSLGGKYLPSVLYKVRQITIDEKAIVSESGVIKTIEIND